MRDRNAPPVTYPVGRTPRLAWALAGLWLAGAAAVFWTFFWILALVHQGYTAIFLGVSVVMSGGLCLAFWRGQRARLLVWDGERWSLEPGSGGEYGDAARPRVRMDLQHTLLLAFEMPSSRRPIWLWAEAAHDPMRWHLLRCALYSAILSTADESAADERA